MRYLIVANGDFLPTEIVKEAAIGRTIIALDGAAVPLMKRGIKPHYILGDLDSIQCQSLLGIEQLSISGSLPHQYAGKFGITIVHCPDQATTDLQKALNFAKEQGATYIDVVCACSNARIDHNLFNVRLLKSTDPLGCTVILHSLLQSMCFVRDSTISLSGEVGDPCAVMAFPEGQFSSTGLVWNGVANAPFPLHFADSESVCNQMAGKQAEICVTGDALVIQPPHFSAQRRCSQWSALERAQKWLYEEAHTLVALSVGHVRQLYSISLRETAADTITGVQRKLKDGVRCLSHTKEQLLKEDAHEMALISLSKDQLQVCEI